MAHAHCAKWQEYHLPQGSKDFVTHKQTFHLTVYEDALRMRTAESDSKLSHMDKYTWHDPNMLIRDDVLGGQRETRIQGWRHRGSEGD